MKINKIWHRDINSNYIHADIVAISGDDALTLSTVKKKKKNAQLNVEDNVRLLNMTQVLEVLL